MDTDQMHLFDYLPAPQINTDLFYDISKKNYTARASENKMNLQKETTEDSQKIMNQFFFERKSHL